MGELAVLGKEEGVSLAMQIRYEALGQIAPLRNITEQKCGAPTHVAKAQAAPASAPRWRGPGRRSQPRQRQQRS
eukprot:8746544-Pyramimonas_sp.AAC.1